MPVSLWAPAYRMEAPAGLKDQVTCEFVCLTNQDILVETWEARMKRRNAPRWALVSMSALRIDGETPSLTRCGSFKLERT